LRGTLEVPDQPGPSAGSPYTPLIMVDGIWVKLEYLNPSGSIKARIARYMIERAAGRHLIEGISDGFVPGIFARHGHLIDEIVAVDSDAAISEMRRLAREFGLFVGLSSGAHLLAARELRARYPDLRHVVTFFCDEGEKYINDYFLGTGSGG